jgi:hypothetical protein
MSSLSESQMDTEINGEIHGMPLRKYFYRDV